MDVDKTVVNKVKESNEDNIITLSTGIKVKLIPINLLLLQNIISEIEFPRVPVVFMEDKGRDVKNPDDPDYKRALKKANEKQGVLIFDFLVLSGIELIDGIPNDGWERKLKLLARGGLLNLSEYDLDDDIDREYLYKRFIAVGTDDFNLLYDKFMVSGERINKKKANFRGNS